MFFRSSLKHEVSIIHPTGKVNSQTESFAGLEKVSTVTTSVASLPLAHCPFPLVLFIFPQYLADLSFQSHLLCPSPSPPLANSLFPWTLYKLAPSQGPVAAFPVAICYLPGISQVLLLSSYLFFGSQMPSVLFSPLGTLIGWNKAERLFTFLTEAVLNSAPAATPFRSEMAPRADGSAVAILSPRVTRTHPKITQSSRGQIRSRAAGFRESMTSSSLESLA